MAGDLPPDPALPEPVRDHLGQQLRSVFTTDEVVPQYLGDPMVPEAFEPQIKRLEVRLKTHEEGTGAVEQALEDLLGADLLPAGDVLPAGNLLPGGDLLPGDDLVAGEDSLPGQDRSGRKPGFGEAR